MREFQTERLNCPLILFILNAEKAGGLEFARVGGSLYL